MKVQRKNKAEIFEPFDLVITIESEEEARTFYAIFNSERNAVLIGYSSTNSLKDAIGNKYMTPREDIIARGIRYRDFYK